ncbi:DoxX family protein [Roseivirga sp.]|uniref:DoxX family protein n=1 Tax=Roseivirga sp. TaxID=1964215 RepID=UPI003B51F2CA
MKALNSVARYLVGGLFIFSGLIKVNDPVGTQIKLEEYFTVFAVDIAPFFEQLKPLALFFSILLSTLEVVLGIAILLKYREKLVTTLLLVMIVFFTFLTFYSAYFNKVTDCGCFGDAIKLTPWQSFIKDIVLLVFILILFVGRKVNNQRETAKGKHIVVAVSTVFCLTIAFLSINHLPFIDFRAYKEGTSIPQAMLPPADNPSEVPKITNYAFWGDESDFTEASLTGKKLLVIVHDVEHTEMRAYPMLNSLIRSVENEVGVAAITASSGSEFENFRHDVQLAIPYYYSDKTLLKTMIRSNPGLVLLQDGEVVKKWHYNDIPDAPELLKELY